MLTVNFIYCYVRPRIISLCFCIVEFCYSHVQVIQTQAQRTRYQLTDYYTTAPGNSSAHSLKTTLRNPRQVEPPPPKPQTLDHVDLQNCTDFKIDSNTKTVPLAVGESEDKIHKSILHIIRHCKDVKVVQKIGSVKTCFVRSLVFPTENGGKRQVTLQRRGKINMKSKEFYEGWTS